MTDEREEVSIVRRKEIRESGKRDIPAKKEEEDLQEWRGMEIRGCTVEGGREEN